MGCGLEAGLEAAVWRPEQEGDEILTSYNCPCANPERKSTGLGNPMVETRGKCRKASQQRGAYSLH
jgi:hypothetical protein